MAIDFLNELENKISALITTLDHVRGENIRLKQELEQAQGKIAEIEAANQSLKNEIDNVTLDSMGHQEKLTTAAERIQGLLAKLETVQ
ncbi:MAG: cell division protein ZapB [Fibrobacter sp.]|nr:cell division protein ZapB [Fibrobacter sp.]